MSCRSAVFLISLSLPLLWSSVRLCESAVVGAFVFPHGGIALNPSRFDTPDKFAKQAAWQIHRSAVEVGRHIQQLRPDLIFLVTPHGIADLRQFMFYLSLRGNGSAQTDNCACPPCCYNIDVKMDADYAKQLVNDLQSAGQNVSGLSFFGPPGEGLEPSDLRWAEVIPLLFVKDLSNTKLVIMSVPARRYKQSVQMVPELLQLGRLLFDKLEAKEQNVAVVISADLAHTHLSSGPYGYSPDAELFDQACGNWASSLHPSYLLDVAPRYVDNAKSCGFAGLVLLQGMLEAGKLSSWSPVLHANFHPDYYGMMVASFQRQSATTTTTTP